MGEGYHIEDRVFVTSLLRVNLERLKGYISIESRLLARRGKVSSAVAGRQLRALCGLKIKGVADLFGNAHIGGGRFPEF